MCCAFSSTSNRPAGTRSELSLVSLGELLETGVCGSPVWASHRPCDTHSRKGELAQSLPPLPILLWADCGFLASRCSEKPCGSALGMADPEFVVNRPSPPAPLMLEIGRPLQPLIVKMKGHWVYTVLCVWGL